MAQFSEVLQELRQQKRLTQLELAAAINVSHNTISAYERGVRIPTIDVVSALADYFQVTADYLIGRTRHSFPFLKLTQPYTETLTVGELLVYLDSLSADQRQTLVNLLGDMQFVATVTKRKQT